MPLRDLEVRYATKHAKESKLADGEGLHLLVLPNGSKLWRVKCRFVGKAKLLSFGVYRHTRNDGMSSWSPHRSVSSYPAWRGAWAGRLSVDGKS